MSLNEKQVQLKRDSRCSGSNANDTRCCNLDTNIDKSDRFNIEFANIATVKMASTRGPGRCVSGIRMPGFGILSGQLCFPISRLRRSPAEHLANAGDNRQTHRSDMHPERLASQGGMPMQYLAPCRQIASPAVRVFSGGDERCHAACRTRRQADRSGMCRERVRRGRFLFEYIETCRKSAFTACIWRTSRRSTSLQQ